MGDSGWCCTVFEVLEPDVRCPGRTSGEEPHGTTLLYWDMRSPVLPQNTGVSG
jgi:hypothetical protein